MSRLVAYLREYRIRTSTRTNWIIDPRGTAVGATWGYQAGTGEAVNTVTMTEESVKRTNLVANPRAVARAWQLAGATGTQDSPAGGPLGLGYRRFTPATTTTTSPVLLAASATGTGATPVFAGRTYTFSAWGRALGQLPTMNMDISVNWYDAAGANLTSDSTYRYQNTGAWVRYAKTLVAPVGAAFAMVAMRFSITAGEVQIGGEMGAAHFMVEERGTLGSYIDGDLVDANGNVYGWVGAANDSQSTLAYNDGPEVAAGYRVPTYIRRTVASLKTTGSSGPWNRVAVGTGASGVAGDEFAATMYVRFSVDVTVNVSVQARMGSVINGSVTIPDVVIPAWTWVRVGGVVTATDPVDNTQVWAVLPAATVLPIGATVDTTAGLSEKSGEVLPYFDGSMPDAAWVGAANLSASTTRTYVLVA